MTTAIRVYSSGGEAGRCDGRCHTAAAPACDCCCGGRLHGVGSSAIAIELQTTDLFGSLEAADKWAKTNGIYAALVKMPGLRGRRSLRGLLKPYRAEQRRLRALGIVPGQTSMWPN